MPKPDGTPMRSLILAGGGVKVAFQAGVLEVWLDEAGIEFDHADGASGGCFNLAMWCQGMSGRRIADNWRDLDPVAGVDVNASELLKLGYAESLFELDGYRRKVFPAWGLDWNAIRSRRRAASFNIYNFSRHQLEVIDPERMSEDLLVASVSLPIWFPPVVLGGDTYIDAVFNTDANLEEAIRRGADELWVIWTVSRRGEWHDGFVAQYFQIIEAAANGRYNQLKRRIAASNRALERGEAGEFGRPIVLRELAAEVGLHYLVNLNRDRFAEAVNQGVAAARAWCRERGIPLAAGAPGALDETRDGFAPPRDEPAAGAATVEFTERMVGFAAAGERDAERGFAAGRRAGSELDCRLTVRVDDVDRFVADPDHAAAIGGTVTSPLVGGQRPVTRGRFNLFVDDGDYAQKRMLYRLHLTDGEGRPLTLVGHKLVRDDPGFDLWSDTSTLYTLLLAGEVGPEGDATAPVVAAGIVRIRLVDFLEQLTTFRSEAPTVAGRAVALGRFGRLFLGKLWDVYAREVLAVGPF